MSREPAGNARLGFRPCAPQPLVPHGPPHTQKSILGQEKTKNGPALDQNKRKKNVIPKKRKNDGKNGERVSFFLEEKRSFRFLRSLSFSAAKKI